MRKAMIAAATLALTLTGADYTATPDGAVPLIWAAHADDVAGVDKLLAAHADPGMANAYGVTALLEASGNGNEVIVEKLLKAGADPNKATPEGQTPLMAAARSGSGAAVQLLLRNGARVEARETWKGQTALMWAAAADQAAAVAMLIAKGADPNARSTVWPVRPPKKEDGNLVSNPPRGGLTPLLYAARQGSLASARLLVAAGADMNLTDPDGISPTVVALLNGHYDLAAWLLEQGADPNVADRWGRSVLYAAIDMHTLEPSVTRPAPKTQDQHSGLEIARLAVARGAKVEATLIEAIPGRGVSDYPDPILRNGTTPFIRAAKTGDVASMRLLIENGANPRTATAQGVTALMAAVGLGWRYGDSEVAEDDAVAAANLCLDIGLDPNAADERGRTALHGAAERGGNKIAEVLFLRGAVLSAKDKEGRTPLDIAKGNGGRGAPEYPRTIELLNRLAASQTKMETK